MANKPDNNGLGNKGLGNNAAQAFAMFSPFPAQYPLAYDQYPLVHDSNLLTPKYTQLMKQIAERKALLEAGAQRAEARAKAAKEAANAAAAEEARMQARLRAMFNNGNVGEEIRRMEEGRRLSPQYNNPDERSLAHRVFAGPPPSGLPPPRLPRPKGVVVNGGRKQGKTRYVTKSRKARKRKYR